MSQEELFRLNLKPYDIPGHPDPKQVRSYDIKEVIFQVMLHPSQKLKGFRFHTIGLVAKKVMDCKADYIDLSKSDYDMVKIMIGNFEGFGAHDLELVDRVMKPEVIKSHG